MEKSKLNLNYARLSDANLDAKAQDIADQMSGNANFPAPHPELDAFNVASAAFTGARIEAASRNKTDIAIKDAKRLALLDEMNTLGIWIMSKANGDRSILISSGFTVSKTPEPRPPLPAPENLKVQEGVNPGEIFVSVQSTPLAKAYLYQYSVSDPSVGPAMWMTQNGSGSKHTITGLESGQRYWLRVNLLGARGQQTVSAVVTKVAQ